MQKHFCTYQISLALKELGFDEKCFALYDGEKQLNYFAIYNGNKKLISNKAILIAENKFINMPKKALAPLWQQVFDWFIEVYKFEIEIQRVFILKELDTPIESYCFYIRNEHGIILYTNSVYVEGQNVILDYYTIRENAILKAIEIIKSQINETI